ncbi:DUF547 domain-containing protein [Saprospiraceae bacterium]|jgi:hypothetical protein|nr:DUF547 domain-containing protein [Bacteroidota bacterium]MDB4727669.1 DUF547 domain-containing protein [Saprospiraceae bacterium]MDF1866412.1 DUF547 domain-containing protein [Saprospiraceae bacterium]
MNVNQLSEQLLLQIKMGEPWTDFESKLANLTLETLKKELPADNHKKAFWINIYNAFFLILRKEKKLDKPEIYRKKAIQIGGNSFSLDDIEHGILRKYRWKFSIGYLPNIFTSSLIKDLAVSKIDYRIHFALNCGAKSCPPIAFYAPEKIENQLEMATLSFLESETDVLNNQKEIHITRLFLWFLGDFGGRKGVRKILKERLNIETKGMKLIFKAYDWEEDLNNYRE